MLSIPMKRDVEVNQDLLNIEDIQSQIIHNYFLTLNENKFEEFSALFSPDGVLFPPFESAIVGRDAICQYLQTTGIEVKAFPQSGTVQPENNGIRIYQISGNVKTSYFTINVVWIIEVNVEQQIVSAKIKLLATLEDLLRFKRD
jgi:hypothetical protein